MIHEAFQDFDIDGVDSHANHIFRRTLPVSLITLMEENLLDCIKKFVVSLQGENEVAMLNGNHANCQKEDPVKEEADVPK